MSPITDFIIYNHAFHGYLIGAFSLIITYILKQKIDLQKKLGLSDFTFREIVDVSKDMVFLADLKGNIIYHSPSAEKKLLFVGSEVNGKNIQSFIHESERNRISVLFSKVQNNIELNPVELQIKRKDGVPLMLEINTSVIHKDGKPFQICGIMHDITRRKEIEKSLNEKVEELSEMNDLMIGREMRVIELREEVEKLKSEIEKLKGKKTV